LCDIPMLGRLIRTELNEIRQSNRLVRNVSRLRARKRRCRPDATESEIDMTRKQIFITGASGFIGHALASELLARGHAVSALTRPGSESKVPTGCRIVHGDALDSSSYAVQVSPAGTFVHLVGVGHPSPSKGAEFRSVDLQSVRQAVPAAAQADVGHFVYLSVARPAPIMREYQIVRAEGERLITQAGLNATFVRPWYVLGPGRRWPMALIPMYAVARLFPATRDGAIRLALVTRDQIVRSMVWAIENPAEGVRALEPPDIRRGGQIELALSHHAA
jgi:nucleoside-diphosphate-sugar epimerase